MKIKKCSYVPIHTFHYSLNQIKAMMIICLGSYQLLEHTQKWCLQTEMRNEKITT